LIRARDGAGFAADPLFVDGFVVTFMDAIGATVRFFADGVAATVLVFAGGFGALLSFLPRPSADTAA
jgi:hypothetical protein